MSILFFIGIIILILIEFEFEFEGGSFETYSSEAVVSNDPKAEKRSH